MGGNSLCIKPCLYIVNFQFLEINFFINPTYYGNGPFFFLISPVCVKVLCIKSFDVILVNKFIFIIASVGGFCVFYVVRRSMWGRGFHD